MNEPRFRSAGADSGNRVTVSDESVTGIRRRPAVYNSASVLLWRQALSREKGTAQGRRSRRPSKVYFVVIRSPIKQEAPIRASRPLVVLDRSGRDHVLQRAIELVWETGGWLTIAAVIGKPLPNLGGMIAMPAMTIEDAHSVADHRNTTARALVPRGIAVRSLLLDDQCRAVLKQVSIGAHDAVVVADRYPRRALRGLARRSPVPIVIVGRTRNTTNRSTKTEGRMVSAVYPRSAKPARS